MTKPVECEALGGPLDGQMMFVRERVCACCGETFHAVTFGVEATLADLILLMRQPLRHYVPDLVLKRLTWAPPETTPQG